MLTNMGVLGREYELFLSILDWICLITPQVSRDKIQKWDTAMSAFPPLSRCPKV